jgi:DNA repair protein RadC
MDKLKKKTNTNSPCYNKHPYSFGHFHKNTFSIINISNSIGVKIITAFEAVQMARKLIIDPNKEHFIVIYLTPIRKKPKCELISLGTLTASIVHPREVFRPAIKYNSTEIIILHNHPSGNILPSNADLELTERLKSAGQLLGIKVLDHVIFIKGNQFYSFKNNLKLIKA